MHFIQKYGYILLIILLCSVFTAAGVMKYSNTGEIVEVTISEGDSLWGLAQVYSDNNRTGKWVNEVMTLNNLQSETIRTGDTLKLPVTAPTQKNAITQLAGDE